MTILSEAMAHGQQAASLSSQAGVTETDLPRVMELAEQMWAKAWDDVELRRSGTDPVAWIQAWIFGYGVSAGEQLGWLQCWDSLPDAARTLTQEHATREH